MNMLNMVQEGDRLEISSPATLENVDRIVDEAMRFVSGRLAGDREFDFKLLLREALINAVVHGCGKARDKTVISRFMLDDETVRVTVSDDGPGFDWTKRMDAEPEADETSGRGLMILRLYSDGVSYNASGNCVTIVKRLQASPAAAASANDPDDTTNARERDMFEIIKSDGLTIIKPEGDIVASVVEDLKALMQKALNDAEGPLAIDLSGAAMIDSMGIGLLIAAHNSLGKKGEKLRLLRPSKDILSLFRTMRLDKHFIISD